MKELQFRSFFKFDLFMLIKFDLFMLIKQQNNSNQSLPLTATIDFLINSLMYLIFLIERLWSFWLLKKFDF